MNNPKTEETVKSLRGCVLDDAGSCDKCVATGEMDCNCRSELMLTAADLIEQLQQELTDERYRHDRLQEFCVAQGEELSKLKAQQRWIPVTERLPQKFENVLVYFDYGNMAVGFWYDVDECPSLWKVWIDDGWYSDTDCEPVYWMPLPEPPKEELT